MVMIYLLNFCEEPAILRLFLLCDYLIKRVCILLPLLVLFMFIKVCIKHVIDGEPITKKVVDNGDMIWYITNATEKEARNDLWKLSKKVKIWVLAIKLELIWFI